MISGETSLRFCTVFVQSGKTDIRVGIKSLSYEIYLDVSLQLLDANGKITHK